MNMHSFFLIRRIDQEMFVAAKENNVPEVRRLLSVGADVNAKDRYDKTPLHCACYEGHLPVVKELLDHGADIEGEDDTGWTPLHYACLKGHLVVAKVLVIGGANILAATNAGRLLPVEYAVSQGHSAVAKYLLREFYKTICRLPLHEFLDDLTSIRNPHSYACDMPPLRDALDDNVLGTGDVVEILEYLVERNPAWISARDKGGSLPLHVACRRGAPFAIVQSLVNNHKASVKSLTPQGDPPLFLACESPETSLDAIFILMTLYPDLVYERENSGLRRSGQER
jgi:ankyrin repeat protein